MSPSKEIFLKQERLILFQDGSVFWPEQGILFIADIHLGKTNHFRKSGIPIPYSVAQENINALRMALERCHPKDVFFLGDLFHSTYNSSWDEMIDLLDSFSGTKFHLIEGNHDILSPEKYVAAGLTFHAEGLQIGPFSLCHHPQHVDHSYVLCGHLHPGVRISGKGKQGMRFKCFWIGREMMVFPSFGPFKGMKVVQPASDDRIYLITSEGILDGADIQHKKPRRKSPGPSV